MPFYEGHPQRTRQSAASNQSQHGNSPFNGEEKKRQINATDKVDAECELDSAREIFSQAKKFELAAQRGDAVALLAILVQDPWLLNHTNEDGASALTLASMNGHTNVVQSLSTQPEIEINHCTKGRATALMLASEFGHEAVVVQLLQHPYIDINAADRYGNTALVKACINGHVGVVDRLLTSGAAYNVKLTEQGQWSALGAACRYGHPELVEMLLSKKDIDVNVAFGHTETPLMHCSNAAVAKLVLKHPHIHDINLQNDHTALTSAAWNNRVDVLKELLSHPGIQVNLINGNGGTPLGDGVKYPEVVRLLLAHPDIDVNRRNQINQTALWYAIRDGHTVSIRLLLEKDGIDVNAPTGGLTYLIMAVELGRQEIISLLLDVPDIQVDTLDDNGLTALGRAIQKKNYGVVNLLLSRHPDKISVDAMENVALEHMAKHLTVDAAVALLLHDIPVYVTHGNLCAKDTHGFSWTTFLDSSIVVASAIRIEAIQRILNHSCFKMFSNTPELVRQLAYTKDQQGREALHTTDATTRDFFKGLMHFCGRYEIFDGPPIHVSPTAVVVNAFDHGICLQVFADNARMDNQKIPCLDVKGFVKCNQTLGRVFTERNVNHKKFQRDADSWRGEFLLWDKDGNGLMSEGEFLHYCRQYFGGKIKVALKFMKNAGEYKRELLSRRGLSSDFILHTLSTLKPHVFSVNVKALTINGELDMSEYAHVLVMPAADRSLEDIHLKERPNDAKVRSMLYEVGMALNHLHESGLVHGDLKKLNVLRVQNALKLIDLDASAKIGDAVGTKFSSGILPPEMFYKLKTIDEIEQYKSYWNSTGLLPSRWTKLKPKNNYVVKAFRHDSTPSNTLPYDLIQATPAIDLWAFGCLMYQMISGEELVATDLNQDVVSDRVTEAASWTPETLKRRIETNIADTATLDLISNLLVVNPDKRLSLDQVLTHTYFSGVSNFEPEMGKVRKIIEDQTRMREKIEEIESAMAVTKILQQESITEVQLHLKQAKEAIMYGFTEANAVLVPTSFVVLPYKVDQINEQENENPAIDFCKRLMTSGKALKDAMAANKPLGDALAGLMSDKTLYLYLIDEVTGDVVTNDPNGVYPIEIPTTNVAFLATAMPWIQGGLSFLKSIKGVAGMMEILGVPSMPDLSSLQGITEALDEPMCSFGVIRDAVPDMPVEKVRGAALRELTRVFERWDEDRTFGGLERVIIESGCVVWTNQTKAKKIRERKRLKQPRQVEDLMLGMTAGGTLRDLF
ncbi:Aste57867_9340 [Aphanomyces stellatus]|uniref:Aste57867_9340 protein n=1 Tax=Aphanomyces stellatus TaxID=120398 RepID=A0A485KMY6_9STRA|nr:hypothetical protein As57867_009304 [Aphanomyces stellatus]VFT86221.1 Aste57867_9340 [Aphanomyces stellatus]